MKKNLFVCLVLSFSAFALMAQTGTKKTNPSFPRHEIGIEYGVGYHPVLNTVNHTSNHTDFIIPTSPDYCWKPYAFADWFRYSQKTDKYEAQNIGSFTIYYLCNITAKHAVGVSANACFLKASIASDVREGVIYRGTDTYLSFISKYRFTYWQKSACSLYIGAALGLTFGIQAKELNLWYNEGLFDSPMSYRHLEGNVWVNPAFQLTLFGVRLGGEHSAANIELGFGNEGIGKVGFSYRF